MQSGYSAWLFLIFLLTYILLQEVNEINAERLRSVSTKHLRYARKAPLLGRVISKATDSVL
uniref:Secreted protein n=1 Tax=Heterorhabditis bacteriophora TaxID=37862 RepID=A0A1I7XB61_HETBA